MAPTPSLILSLLLMLVSEGTLFVSGQNETFAPTMARPTAAKVQPTFVALPIPIPSLATSSPTQMQGLAHYPSPLLKWEAKLPNTGTVQRQVCVLGSGVVLLDQTWLWVLVFLTIYLKHVKHVCSGFSFHFGNEFYPTNPWHSDHSGRSGPRRHNAVQVSPDDMLVYVTLDDGTLHILDANTGILKTSHTPYKENGWNLQCKSGVDFFTRNGEMFALYAVLDVPPTISVVGATSRVIAIDHASGQVRWTSKPMAGEISGTGCGSDGKFIYLTRNTEAGTNGHFTLLSAANGDIVFTESSTVHNLTGPYAPLALVHNPVRGNFGPSNNGNRNDVAIWGQSTDDGKSMTGASFGFQLPKDFVHAGISAVQPFLLKTNAWTTNRKPTLSEDGLNLYFSASKASLRGWNTRFGRKASWKAEQLEKNPDEGRTALYSSPTLSLDEKKLFVASASTFFYAINATSGETVWRVETDSPIVTEARISRDGKSVYSIEQGNGKIVSRNTVDGSEFWSVTCGKFDTNNPFCQYHVMAEFSLSRTGYYLYYGDAFGRVRALTVGFAAEPSTPPTEAPTLVATLKPVNTAPVSDAPTKQTATTTAPSTVTKSPIESAMDDLAPAPSNSPTEDFTARPEELPTLEPSAISSAAAFTKDLYMTSLTLGGVLIPMLLIY